MKKRILALVLALTGFLYHMTQFLFVYAVAVTAVDHLRVARDNAHASFLGHLGHGLADTPQAFHGKALFKNESAAQIQRHGTACGHVVDRSAHRKAPDVAAREEMRRDNEAVGGIRQALAWGKPRKHGGVIAATKLVAAVRLDEHLVDNALHHASATAVAEHDRCVLAHGIPLE